MSNSDSAEKMKFTLQQIGHKPPIQGGNGKGPTTPEKKLADALNWLTNVVVPTRIPKGNGYPTCYKLDIGNAAMKVGIEVDGSSHHAKARQEQDEKKTKLLSELGWTVLRFSNQEVMENLSGCVQTVLSTISKLTPSTLTLPLAS